MLIFNKKMFNLYKFIETIIVSIMPLQEKAKKQTEKKSRPYSKTSKNKINERKKLVMKAIGKEFEENDEATINRFVKDFVDEQYFNYRHIFTGKHKRPANIVLHLKGFSDDEIAKILNIDMKTVKSLSKEHSGTGNKLLKYPELQQIKRLVKEFPLEFGVEYLQPEWKEIAEKLGLNSLQKKTDEHFSTIANKNVLSAKEVEEIRAFFRVAKSTSGSWNGTIVRAPNGRIGIVISDINWGRHRSIDVRFSNGKSESYDMYNLGGNPKKTQELEYLLEPENRFFKIGY